MSSTSDYCLRCQGRGWLPSWASSGLGVSSACPNCGGTGRVMPANREASRAEGVAGRKRVPICSHPSETILEEMRERGWSSRDVAERMGGPVDVAECELELYLHVHSPGVVLGETADRLGRAFGIDPQFFRNLHQSWVDFIEDAVGMPALEARLSAQSSLLQEARVALEKIAGGVFTVSRDTELAMQESKEYRDFVIIAEAQKQARSVLAKLSAQPVEEEQK